MFQYSDEKIQIPIPMFSCSLMLNYAGEAGDSRRQLMIVSRLDGRPRVAIWMRVGVDNNRPPAAAHLHLRRVMRRTTENDRCPMFQI